jgi:hypothetical protein
MSTAWVVIMAVVPEGRSQSAVAWDYGGVRRWVPTLTALFPAEGEVDSSRRRESVIPAVAQPPHDPLAYFSAREVRADQGLIPGGHG